MIERINTLQLLAIMFFGLLGVYAILTTVFPISEMHDTVLTVGHDSYLIISQWQIGIVLSCVAFWVGYMYYRSSRITHGSINKTLIIGHLILSTIGVIGWITPSILSSKLTSEPDEGLYICSSYAAIDRTLKLASYFMIAGLLGQSLFLANLALSNSQSKVHSS